MGRRLTKVIISCMAQSGQRVAAIMALVISGLIFLYILTWNAASSSGLYNCPSILIWNVTYHLVQLTQWFISLFNAYCLPIPPQVHVGNGINVFLFWCQPNRGHLDQIMRTVDVESLHLTSLFQLVVRRIGTEYLVCLVFEGKVNKEGGGVIRVNIYASKIFFIQKKVIFKDIPPPPPFFRTMYERNNVSYKQMIQRETDKNRIEDTYMWRKIENTRIKNSHVKE